MYVWTKENFHRTYEKYSDLVYRLCLLYLKNESDAKDGLQDIFLKLWEKKPSFKNEQHTQAWLIRTTKNYCLDILKGSWHKKRVRFEPKEFAEKSSPQETAGENLFDVITTLPEKYREVLYLYYYEEYSCKEIAEMMQKKESTVRSLLKRGREALQKKIGGDGYATGLESHLGQSQSG